MKRALEIIDEVKGLRKNDTVKFFGWDLGDVGDIPDVSCLIVGAVDMQDVTLLHEVPPVLHGIFIVSDLEHGAFYNRRILFDKIFNVKAVDGATTVEPEVITKRG